MRSIDKAIRHVQGHTKLEAPDLSESLNLTGGGIFFAYLDNKPLYRRIKGPSLKVPKIKNLKKFIHGIMVKKSLRLRLPESLRRYLASGD